ncbi:hypothetical protein ST201phi2-1p284 [Pseudomonas phage 201phi2-1]|uniref:Uncharacterized protein n=1 Tax=Pseudomonas phage 201phi2-1 TaxID=198110 RepID=B3FJE5_BP201|nr:hypothetical protein ST201phi2-1p284 [Pseudomonas phage 201phi2-1]ABY63111.1 hypothetical protein 201phi2-1p284 [Pseudomonas phage 201phi2-1]
MNIEDFKNYQESIIEFCKANDIREFPETYFVYRKRLVEIANDKSIDNTVRINAAELHSQIKWTFNAVYGRGLADQLRKYPESTLYDNGQCLTTRCRTKVVQLAERFAFKPQPLVLGIKHYWALNNGT